MLAARDEAGWLRLYDTANESVQGLLYDRFHANRRYQVLDVVDQLIWHPIRRQSAAAGDGSRAIGQQRGRADRLIQFGR